MREFEVTTSADGKPTAEPTDRSLLARLRQGCQDAATQLYGRYARRLRELAAAQCSAELARQVEVEDIVQSVFGSFFRGASQGQYDLPDGEQLWRLFLVIALNKIRHKARYHRAARRDRRRTVGGEAYELSLQTVADVDGAAETLLEMTVADALGRLPAGHRQAIEWRIAGHGVAEIADRLGRSLRSTERILQEARQRLAVLLPTDEPAP